MNKILNLISIIRLYPLWAQISIVICGISIVICGISIWVILVFAPRKTPDLLKTDMRKIDMVGDVVKGDKIAGDKIINHGTFIKQENTTIDKKPYVRFSKNYTVIFKVPTIKDLTTIIPQNNNLISAEKFGNLVNSLSKKEQENLCQVFRGVFLHLDLENSGNTIARDIKGYWDKHSFLHIESLDSKEKTDFRTSNSYFINLSMSSRNEKNNSYAVPPPKNYEAWLNLIEKIKKMTQEGKKIGSDLDFIYKNHRIKIPIEIEIVWLDLNNNKYKNTAKTNLYWDGEKDCLETWEYSFK
jgi:hypothetical protein